MMTRASGGFGVLDVLILLIVGVCLVAAAMYSEDIVRATEQVTELTPPPIEWRDHYLGGASPAPGALWMAGSNGKIVRSNDGGQSWSVQKTDITDNLQDIDAWDAEHAVAVGNDATVVVSGDGGETWARVSAPRSEIANKLIRVQCFEGGKAWAVGVMGTILSTEDWGASWKRRAEEVDVAWNDIAFADDQNGWVVGEFGSMMHSSDGGETWQEVLPVSERSLMAISFQDPEKAVAVGLDGLILQTNDSGQTWTTIDAGTAMHLFDVIWDGASWIAVGGMGVVVTGDPGQGSWKAHRLSENDMAWHTNLAPTEDGVFVVGASQGLWRDGQWDPVSGG
jgi:photosystem II stability/assembly factor-like uncharacterized protein